MRAVVSLVFMALFTTPAHAAESPCARAAALGGAGQHLVYLKREHTLCLQEGERTLWYSPASHGRNAGKKQFEGDGRTPEGTYTLSPGRKSSRFGTFLSISYPNAADVRFARAQGRPAGSAVGIHGPQRWYAFLGRWQAALDHSDGCIVLDSDAIEALAQRVQKPLPLEIVP